MHIRPIKGLSPWSVFFCVLWGGFATASDNAVGIRQFPVHSEARGTDLTVSIWYPAASGGTAVTLGESVFFEGTPARQDAPIAAGSFPLVLLSHGAGLAGRAEAMSWIAAPLAEQGYIVAAPTHPYNTGPDRSAEETMKLWLRPTDLTETLDYLETEDVFAPVLEPGRVGVLGLSMGGNTALSIAGARLDPERLAGYCDTLERNASLCGWVRISGVDLHGLDRDAAGADYRDERVRFAMAIDPALVDVFVPDSFAGISVPVALVNLGAPGDVPVTLDAGPVAEAMSQASYEIVEDANHFSMFGLCKPMAAEIAREEGIEEPICDDGATRSRAKIHADMIDRVIAHFAQNL